MADPASVHDQHVVGVLDGRQPVGDHHCRATLLEPREGRLDLAFGFRVERRCCLVE